MGRIIVAVDGPAGSGKSSVSKEAAVRNGLKYIDSGALYRAVTLYFLETHGQISRDTDFEKGLAGLVITQEFSSDGSSQTYIHRRNVSADIRNEIIAKNIGIVSDDIKVREFVNRLLREWAKNDSILMDGRDIGTVVFPDADIKIYLDASVDVRAERRIKEYREMGKNLDENDIKNQIILRDEQDKSRPVGKLVQAGDAIYLDTSGMNKEQVISRIDSIIRSYSADHG